MELILKYKSYIIISLSFLLLVIGCFFYFKPKNSTKENNNQLNLNDQTEIEVIEEKKDIQENIMVDIKGYIKKPGVYTMKDGDRVIDQTTPNMIQRLNTIFKRNPLISMGI